MSNSSRPVPLEVMYRGLNQTVKTGDKVRLELYYVAPSTTDNVFITLHGTPDGSTEPAGPSEPTDLSTDPMEPINPIDPTKPAGPTEPTEPENSEPEPGTVALADPAFVDPATASECVEKTYINIPNAKGVDYYLNAGKRLAGSHVYGQNKLGTVKIAAVAQLRFKLAPNAHTEWTFNLSGEVKDCSDSSEDLEPSTVDGRHFDATGHEFAVKADPVGPKKPDVSMTRMTEGSHVKYATMRVETDVTSLNPQKYSPTLGQTEPGVALQKRNVNTDNGFITMEVVSVKDSKSADPAVMPKDAAFALANNLSQSKSPKVTLDVCEGKKDRPKPSEIISLPDRAKWMYG